MFSERELSQLKAVQRVARELDDIFFVETRETPIKIKTIDGDSIVLVGYRYAVLVKNVNEKECQLSIAIAEPKPDSKLSGKTIVVKKGQYIELKQTSQYQESEKKREERHNQLPKVRFKNWAVNWAKDIWVTKRNDIMVRLLFLIIGLLLGYFLQNMFAKD